ncbi:hypothetical protein Tsubulata_023391 [Turnera subulata]|uniref:GTD-binding domain-containing protein n=1 Tax=Turnera subulata TaxID=218843 RepID=A0A9Q0FAA0_9ROSI|nr:hypothetical protein Tsubulata_023391 [Turnera subulata]
MAGNKFATMLHRNTHKLTVILVYAVLEWILIILLLLNSLFTYLITKFANYFGLKPPCPWCSRVDHMLEPGNNAHSYRNVVCETHATEISRLSYCTSHHRLAETQNMCLDCLASRPNRGSDDPVGITRRIAFISWVSKGNLEDEEMMQRCSCCDENLSRDLCPPYLMFKPSWGSLKYTEKGGLVIEMMDEESDGKESKESSKTDGFLQYTEDANDLCRSNEEEQLSDGVAADEHQILSDVGSFGLKDAADEECSRSESNSECDETEGNEDHKAGSLDIAEPARMKSGQQLFGEAVNPNCLVGDDSLEFISFDFETSHDSESRRLIPVELIDSSTTANHGSCNLSAGDMRQVQHINDVDSLSQIETKAGVQKEEAFFLDADKENMFRAEMQNTDMDSDEGFKISALNTEKKIQEAAVNTSKQVIASQEDPALSISDKHVEAAETDRPSDLPGQEEEKKGLNLLVEQTESKHFPEMPDNTISQLESKESDLYACPQEDHSHKCGNGEEFLNGSESYMVANESGPDCSKKTSQEAKMVSAEKNPGGVNHHSSVRLENNEVEEEKFPETPTSTDSIHFLHKKFLMFEKRESGTEDSLDGSVVSEMDSSDPVSTIERLKTAVKAERKALSALYAELEEERSASAIAANQTMAMITRLQEEKAAMQMEALQYQRMMEEQSEYDQEALQLLNELMVKREKEKQELEKELEIYRKKVLDYEAKERVRMVKRLKDGSTRSRNSSATCSMADDIEGLSIDLNREAEFEDGSVNENEESNKDGTPADDVTNLQEIALDCVKQMSALDDSLAEFEEERLSILDQLKVLEEKLITLGANELNDDMSSAGHSSKYSVERFDESYKLYTPEENGISESLSKDKLNPDRKTMASMAKSLLPLLDAAENETEEGLVFGGNEESEIVEMETSSACNFELDSKKLAIEEEVDHVYERLQALEADREFLKHCMSSIQKGDKGMDLLQEILQHLRDLKAVELSMRNLNDHPVED